MAKANGIIGPLTVAKASVDTGLNFAAACALLMVESSGGHNEYGHDHGMPFEGAGHVTETNYAEYVAERDSFDPPRCQGVGPCQLTYIGYQNDADALGGCWDPYSNMVVGFGIVKGYRDQGLSWRKAWAVYNGGWSNPDYVYADKVETYRAQFKLLFNPPPPSELSFTSEYAAKAAQPQGETMKPYLKSGLAFVIAFATALYATVQGRTDIDTMKSTDWMIVVLGALVTAGATFYVPYAPTNSGSNPPSA